MSAHDEINLNVPIAEKSPDRDTCPRPTTTVDLAEHADARQKDPKSSWFPPIIKAWVILSMHGIASVGLALGVSLGLHGYQAGDDSRPHHVDGRLLLRVSDITTLISASLMVIKVITDSWSTTLVWSVGYYMLCRAKPPAEPKVVSSMIRKKLPPWPHRSNLQSTNLQFISISLAMLGVLAQAFVNPLLTGSVNWNVGFHVSKASVPVNSTNPEADFGNWDMYNKQGTFNKRAYLRLASGLAISAWADPSILHPNGMSISGNGCRHRVNNDGLPPNSTLIDASIPCINIHDIHWYRSEAENNGKSLGENISLVGDNPLTYYQPGVSFVFDMDDKRMTPTSTNQPPAPYMFSGTKTVMLLIKRQKQTAPSCKGLTNTIFGDVSSFPYFYALWNGHDENCYMLGKINFTAGVTTSSQAKYLNSRVVEDQTAIQTVEFESNPWVHDAIWLLPDLMTLLGVMNATQLPIYGNIDGYVSGLLRQSYLGAWDAFSRGFDTSDPISHRAYPADTRIIASVSYARVFSWLAICLLMLASGTLVLGIVLRSEDFELYENIIEQRIL